MAPRYTPPYCAYKATMSCPVLQPKRKHHGSTMGCANVPWAYETLLGEKPPLHCCMLSHPPTHPPTYPPLHAYSHQPIATCHVTHPLLCYSCQFLTVIWVSRITWDGPASAHTELRGTCDWRAWRAGRGRGRLGRRAGAKQDVLCADSAREEELARGALCTAGYEDG